MSEIVAFYTQGAFVEELFSSWSGGIVAAMLIISWIVPLIVNAILAIATHSVGGHRYGALGVFGAVWALLWAIGWIIVAMINLAILGVCLYYYIAHFSTMSHFGAIAWAIVVIIAPTLVIWLSKLLFRLVALLLFRRKYLLI